MASKLVDKGAGDSSAGKRKKQPLEPGSEQWLQAIFERGILVGKTLTVWIPIRKKDTLRVDVPGERTLALEAIRTHWKSCATTTVPA